MDISEELEAAIPHGPALPDPAERVAAGGARLRRRRAVVGVGTAVAVAAIVVPTAVLAAGGDQRSVEQPPASQRPAPTPTPALERSPASEQWPKGQPAARVAETADGGFQPLVREAAVIHERRDDIYPGKDTESVALDLSYRDSRHWIILEWAENQSSGIYSRPGRTYDSFDQFVASSVRDGGIRTGGPGGSGVDADEWPTVGEVAGLSFDGDGFVLDGEGTILEQRLDPGLPDNFTERSDVTGAAYLEQAGVRYLALYRGTESKGQLFAVESAGHGDSLDELLTWARQRYQDGVGLL